MTMKTWQMFGAHYILCFSLILGRSSCFMMQPIPIARPALNKHLFSELEGSSLSSSSSSSPSSVPAYIVIEAQITNMELFADYAMLVPSIIKQYGGEYVVLKGKHIPLEGDWGYDRSSYSSEPRKTGSSIDDVDSIDDDVNAGTDEDFIRMENTFEEGDEEILRKILGLNSSIEEEKAKDRIETKIVIQKWPNTETAQKFWNSPEYAQVKRLREGTGTFRIMLVEGIPNVDEDLC